MDIDKLKAAGFVEATYPGQEGVFLVKRMPIAQMPNALDRIANGESVTGEDTVVIEVVPDPLFPGAGVQLIVKQSDYYEEAVAVDSDDGIALLRDAGVAC